MMERLNTISGLSVVLSLVVQLGCGGGGEIEEIEGMVYVPGGIFWLGCNPDVCVGCCDLDLNDLSDFNKTYSEEELDGYYIDIYEVTAGQYKECVGSGVCQYTGESNGYHTYNNNRDDHPINNVTLAEAKTYCDWVGKAVPTRKHWEKAARGGCEFYENCKA